MRLYKQKEKISNGITCMSRDDKSLFVGNVDDAFNIYNNEY